MDMAIVLIPTDSAKTVTAKDSVYAKMVGRAQNAVNLLACAVYHVAVMPRELVPNDLVVVWVKVPVSRALAFVVLGSRHPRVPAVNAPTIAAATVCAWATRVNVPVTTVSAAMIVPNPLVVTPIATTMVHAKVDVAIAKRTFLDRVARTTALKKFKKKPSMLRQSVKH